MKVSGKISVNYESIIQEILLFDLENNKVVATTKPVSGMYHFDVDGVNKATVLLVVENNQQVNYQSGMLYDK